MSPVTPTTQTQVTAFPTVDPKNIPDGYGGSSGCLINAVECTTDDSACDRCGSAFSCEPVSTSDTVHLETGVVVPGAPGKKFCLPSTPDSHDPKKINPLTTRIVWSETGCPGTSQCWKKLCKYPSLFGGPDCDQQVACFNGADPQANNVLVEATCPLKQASLQSGEECYDGGTINANACSNYYVNFDAGNDRKLKHAFVCKAQTNVDAPPYKVRNGKQFRNQHWLGFFYRGRRPAISDFEPSNIKPGKKARVQLKATEQYGTLQEIDNLNGALTILLDSPPQTIQNINPSTVWLVEGSDDRRRYAIMIPLDTAGGRSYGNKITAGSNLFAWDGVQDNIDEMTVVQITALINNAMAELFQETYQQKFAQLFNFTLDDFASGEYKNDPQLARLGSLYYPVAPLPSPDTESLYTDNLPGGQRACPQGDPCPGWQIEGFDSGYKFKGLAFDDTKDSRSTPNMGLPNCGYNPVRQSGEAFKVPVSPTALWGPDKAMGLTSNSKLMQGEEYIFHIDPTYGVTKNLKTNRPRDVTTKGRRVRVDDGNAAAQFGTVTGPPEYCHTDTGQATPQGCVNTGDTDFKNLYVPVQMYDAQGNPQGGVSYHAASTLSEADPTDTVLVDVEVNTDGQVDYLKKLIEGGFEIMDTEHISFMLDCMYRKTPSVRSRKTKPWFADPRDPQFDPKTQKLHDRYKPVSVFELLGGGFQYTDSPPRWNSATNHPSAPWTERNKLSDRVPLQRALYGDSVHIRKSFDDGSGLSYYRYRPAEDRRVFNDPDTTTSPNGTIFGINTSRCVKSNTVAPFCGTSTVWSPSSTSVATLTKNPMNVTPSAHSTGAPTPDFVCDCDNNQAPQRIDGIPFVRLPDDPYSCHIDPCYSSMNPKLMRGLGKALQVDNGKFTCNCNDEGTAKIFRGTEGQHQLQCGLTTIRDQSVCGIDASGSPLGTFEDSRNSMAGTNAVDHIFRAHVPAAPGESATSHADLKNLTLLKWDNNPDIYTNQGFKPCTPKCYPRPYNISAATTAACKRLTGSAACTKNKSCMYSTINPADYGDITCLPSDLPLVLSAGKDLLYTPATMLRELVSLVNTQHAQIKARMTTPSLPEFWDDVVPVITDFRVQELDVSPTTTSTRNNFGRVFASFAATRSTKHHFTQISGGTTNDEALLPNSPGDGDTASGTGGSERLLWEKLPRSLEKRKSQSVFGSGCQCNVGSTRGVCTSEQTTIDLVDDGWLYNFEDDINNIARPPPDATTKLPQANFSEPVLAGTCDFSYEVKEKTAKGYRYLFPDGHLKNLLLCRGNACMPNNVCACQQVYNAFGEQCYDWCSAQLNICSSPSVSGASCKGFPNSKGKSWASEFQCTCVVDGITDMYGVEGQGECVTSPLPEDVYILSGMMTPDEAHDQVFNRDKKQKTNEKCDCDAGVLFEPGTAIASISYNMPCNDSSIYCTIFNAKFPFHAGKDDKYGNPGGQFSDDFCFAYDKFDAIELGPDGLPKPNGNPVVVGGETQQGIGIAKNHFLVQRKAVDTKKGDNKKWMQGNYQEPVYGQGTQDGRDASGISNWQQCKAYYKNSYPPIPKDTADKGVYSNYPIGNASVIDTGVLPGAAFDHYIFDRLWPNDEWFKAEPTPGSGEEDYNQLNNMQIIALQQNSFVKWGQLQMMTESEHIAQAVSGYAEDAALGAGAFLLSGGVLGILAAAGGGSVDAFADIKSNFDLSQEAAYFRNIPARMSVTQAASSLPRIPYQFVGDEDSMVAEITGNADDEVSALLENTYSVYCASGKGKVQTHYNMVFDDKFREYIAQKMSTKAGQEAYAKAKKTVDNQNEQMIQWINEYPRCFPCVTTQVFVCQADAA